MSVRVVLCEDHAALRAIVRETCLEAGHEVVGRPPAPPRPRPSPPAGRPRSSLDLSSGGTPASRSGPSPMLAPSAAIVAYTGLAVGRPRR